MGNNSRRRDGLLVSHGVLLSTWLGKSQFHASKAVAASRNASAALIACRLLSVQTRKRIIRSESSLEKKFLIYYTISV